ncbi:rhomboid family intramembrane serine protease [Hyalangium rubrum]|uniref:Rhomboid family intramembrane serine protease n=1 Tax=Hyalangium rubrum TaxID=3103134 RepID=A0ABU5H9B1_9BACT|nr:rhomboid family intramembrane serine protease [Hyalangium sp. s54d21]MDY7228685.1 rhomboid family intramembrane serine protease [Hyalangium sp. s54d21]
MSPPASTPPFGKVEAGPDDRGLLARLPWVTLGLALINLAAYAFTAAAGPLDVDAMVRFGAKVGPLITEAGQPWRLLTANLLHRDGAHLGLNVLVLVAVGAVLESAYRRLDYAALLLASGLATMTSSLLWAEEVSVGASGMAYGCVGALIVLGRRHRALLSPLARRMAGEGVLPTVLVFLWMGWTSVGVDNAGHLGGFAAGLLVGLFLVPRKLLVEETRRTGLLRAGSVAVVALVLSGVGVLGRSSWRVERDDVFGVSVAMPGSWRQGADRLGRLAFSNGLPGLGRASFAAEAIEAGEPGDGELQARRFMETTLSPQGSLPEGQPRDVRGPEPAWVHGRRAQRVRGRLHGPEGSFQVMALFVPRGEFVYQLVFTWPEAFPRYDRVVARMAAELRLEEPATLREARARALLVPGVGEPLHTLGAALRRWGRPAEAVEPLLASVKLAPSRVETRVELARAFFESGHVEEGCHASEEALVYGPTVTVALEAGVRCELARGDMARALQRLEEARRVDPLDPRLRAAEAALRATVEAGGR